MSADVAKRKEIYDIEVANSLDGFMWLDDAREQFCRLVVQRLGIAAAYKQAINPDVSTEVALSLGATLARQPEVSDRIVKLEEDRVLVRNASKDSLVSDYIRMTRCSAVDYFNEDWTLKPKSEWTKDMRLACKSIEKTKFGWKLDLYGKTEVMDKVSDMMGYNAPKQSEVRVTNDLKSVDIDELKKMAGVEDVDCEVV